MTAAFLFWMQASPEALQVLDFWSDKSSNSERLPWALGNVRHLYSIFWPSSSITSVIFWIYPSFVIWKMSKMTSSVILFRPQNDPGLTSQWIFAKLPCKWSDIFDDMAWCLGLNTFIQRGRQCHVYSIVKKKKKKTSLKKQQSWCTLMIINVPTHK